MNYTTTPLEDSIQKLYEQIGIVSPNEIDEFAIAESLNLGIKYIEGHSHFVNIMDKYYILINSILSKKEKWQQFAHELCHVLKHVGNQLTMPQLLIQLQEWQAKNFALHFCVPTFMLLEQKLPNYRTQAIYHISEQFCVTLEFAKTRLEHFERQLNGFRFYDEMRTQITQYEQLVQEESAIYISTPTIPNINNCLINKPDVQVVYGYHNEKTVPYRYILNVENENDLWDFDTVLVPLDAAYNTVNDSEFNILEDSMSLLAPSVSIVLNPSYPNHFGIDLNLLKKIYGDKVEYSEVHNILLNVQDLEDMLQLKLKIVSQFQFT